MTAEPAGDALRYFEDFVVGDVIDLGSSAPVSEDDIVAFARQWDPQPFHVDPERARESIFGGLIASGWHTGAIAMRMVVDRILSRSHSQGSPGVDEIRFLRPVRAGDVLSGRYTVVEASPSATRPRLGKVRSRVELFNQRGELVMTWRAMGFFDRREGARLPPTGEG